MDKGKSPFCVMGEKEGALASNISFVAAPSSASAAPEPADVMQFWHDIGMILESPERNAAHHSTHSETLNSAEDPRLVGSNGKNSEEDLLSMLLDMDMPSLECAPSPFAMMRGETFMMKSPPLPAPIEKNLSSIPNEELSIRNLERQFLDGSSSSKSDPLASKSIVLSSMVTRKRYSNAELTDIALLDPKRVKKIMTNRQSAMRCKEKKMCYTSELEQKAQTLQMLTTRLFAKLMISKRNHSALTFENKDLTLRLQIMEERTKLQEELTNSLRAERQQLQVNSGQRIDCGNSSLG